MRPSLEWVVQPGDGRRVRQVLVRMRSLGGAADGEAWLNGRPADDDEPVEPGDRIELRPLRATSGESVRLLAQRDGIVLAYKPAGMPTEPAELGGAAQRGARPEPPAHDAPQRRLPAASESFVERLSAALGGARIHAASHLDVGVSGVVVCTLGPVAARRFEALRAAGHFRKTYLGLAHGELPSDGQWDAPLGTRREARGKLRASDRADDARPALTHFRVLARAGGALLVELRPVTGRMHQLRAHAALGGAPLYGDSLYGGPTTITDERGAVHRIDRVMLHAYDVACGALLGARASVPDAMRVAWTRLGGLDADWSGG